MFTASQKNIHKWWKQSSVLLLLFSFLLPFIAVAQTWGVDAEAGLPACCRSHGKHRCFMRLQPAGKAQTSGLFLQKAGLSEKCPCTTLTITHTSTHDLSLPGCATRDIHLEQSSHQALSQCQIAKQTHLPHSSRGPPSSSLYALTTFRHRHSSLLTTLEIKCFDL